MTRKYELVLILSPSLTEEEVKNQVKSIVELCESRGARDIVNESWGKLPLAYKLKKAGEGNFRCLYFSSDNGEIIDFLTQRIRLLDAVVKFQAHRISERVRKVKVNPHIKPGSSNDGLEVAY